MDLTLWERALGWFWAFAMVLFVGLIIVEIVKNRKEKPLPKIVILLMIISFTLRLILPNLYGAVLLFIGSTICVIYIFRTYYIQEREKKE